MYNKNTYQDFLKILYNNNNQIDRWENATNRIAIWINCIQMCILATGLLPVKLNVRLNSMDRWNPSYKIVCIVLHSNSVQGICLDREQSQIWHFFLKKTYYQL